MDHPLVAISNFAVTDKCNGRCKMCNIWNTTPRPEPQIEQIQAFFKDNKTTLQKIKFIQITGGEPYLREDLPEITEVIHKNLPDCMIWIPTNGLLPEQVQETTTRIIDRIDALRLGVSVSLDGDAEVNDAQRGVEGSFRNAVRTIKKLAELKQKHGFSLSTGFTVTESNYVCAPIVQKIAYRLGSEFSFRPVNLSEHYYRNPEQSPLDREEILTYLDYIGVNLKQQKGLIKPITNYAYIQGAKEFIKGKRTLPCTAGTESIYIDTVGDVYPCLVMNHKLGNIYQHSLTDILASPSAWEAREIIEKLECPTCWLECEVYRDLVKDRKRLVNAFRWAVTLSS